MGDEKVVVGVFADQGQARQALHELLQAGFSSEHIGFLVRDETSLVQGTPTEKLQEETADDAAKGAVTGGVLGGLLGAAASLLIPGLGPVLTGGILTTLSGVVLGAATGGVMATLRGMGIPEEEARSYDEAVQAGRTIVIVQTEDRLDDAYAILKQNFTAIPTDTEPTNGSDPAATVELDPSQ